MSEKMSFDLTDLDRDTIPDSNVQNIQRRLGSVGLGSHFRNNNDSHDFNHDGRGFDREQSRTLSPEPNTCSAKTCPVLIASNSLQDNNITATKYMTYLTNNSRSDFNDRNCNGSSSSNTFKPSALSGCSPFLFRRPSPSKFQKQRLVSCSASARRTSRLGHAPSDIKSSSKHLNEAPSIYEISDDDEDVNNGSIQYQKALYSVRSRESRFNLAVEDTHIVEETDNIDEDETVDDTVPFSTLPLPLQQDDDVQFIKEITRREKKLSAQFEQIDRVKGKRYTCAPGKCVQLKDGSFIRIVKIVKDDANTTWIIGQLFLRHNEFPDHKWPRRHNEVLHMLRVKNGRLTDLVKRPLEQVVKNRQLILTNQSFPAMSVKTHPDAWSDVHFNKEVGPLFCRWRLTLVRDSAERVLEESIERLPYESADLEARIEESDVRIQWRQRPTVLGGGHTYFKTQVEDIGHGMEEAQKYVFGDTFCGGGGASCGAEEAGLFVKFGVDFNEQAIKTYRLNFSAKGTQCQMSDIHDFIAKIIPARDMIDVLHMSPPCQTFSPAHTIPNLVNDERNSAAMFAVGELLRTLRPRVATLEETFGLLSRHEEWFDALVKMFLDCGYSVRWRIAKLEEYGLPQKRRRLLIIAAGPGEVLPPFPAITHSASDPGLKKLTTIYDAISSIPSRSTISHHDIQAVMYQPDQIRIPYSPHTQAKTITTSGGIGNHHPSGKRAFTIRELAAMQNFPSTYKFPDIGVTALRRQIGNAVPPFIFKKIYREIIKSLKKTDGVQ